ncbi:MAG: bifunctional glutamate N-acetyltransferase/amino-acid acetyltransferase ArgJ [Dehalococcoidia bacterium]|nr:bifunctional glutamate N-acetyltransferase/amino-acid acetyltransferase ArgJ [Dehalococcoidia bacterium]
MTITPLENGTVTSPRGFRAGAVHAGIRSDTPDDVLDVTILVADGETTGAAVFTKNKVTAAPVVLSREHIAQTAPRAVVVNSGNANAAVGDQGMTDARASAQMVAEKLGLRPEEVLVCSTGVIGAPMPMDVMRRGIDAVELMDDAGHDFALAIMTTDLVSKESAATVEIDGKTVTVAGATKGSGMIHPDMATMLAFVTTDAAIEQNCLNGILKRAVSRSFNMISVDGDTSTNDTLIVIANGAAGNASITGGEDAALIEEAITHVSMELAKAIVRDGEGATKLIEINVSGALSDDDARQAARVISTSPLVKTAVFGNDPNWGRVMMALGRSGVEMQESRVSLHFNDICVLENGQAVPFDRDEAVERMKQAEVRFDVSLGLGDAAATAWTCDFSYEYVRINGEYTT